MARMTSQQPAGEAAVDGDDGARHVRGAVGGEEHRDRRDLRRGAESAHGDLPEVALGRAVGAVHLPQPLGVDPARGDRVHGDPLRPELARQRLQPADDTRPHRVREGEVRERLPHRRGLDRDDASAAALTEMGQAPADQRHVRGEEERDGLLDRLRRHRRRRPGRRPAPVQHEHVEAAERPHRRLHEPLEVLRDREVALDGERADPLRLALEELPAAREHGHVRPLGGEGLGDREPHPGGGAADDRRAPCEPEVHGRRRLPAGSFSAREACDRNRRRTPIPVEPERPRRSASPRTSSSGRRRRPAPPPRSRGASSSPPRSAGA